VCGVANIHRVEICCIGSRGTAGVFMSISQVIFTPIVVFIEKIRPHPHIKYGMTNVNFRFLGYREQPFVLANDVTQVFCVKDPDPTNKEEDHIVLHGKKFVGVEDVVDEEEYNQFVALPPFNDNITIPTIDDTEDPT
jgi:hypothetical protein